MNSASDLAPVFELRQVTQRFSQFSALNDVSLQIYPGERVALVGSSGAGKSTLLRLLNGTLLPSQGEVWALGQNLSRLSSRKLRFVQRQIGTIYQQFHLVDSLRVIHNVNAGHLGHWSFLRAALSLVYPLEVKTAAHALHRVGIPEKLYARTDQLSGGQQQRVALARSLASQPEVLLLDEPFSALDTHLRSQIEQQMIASLKTYAGVTLFVTHNLEEAYRVCQNLLVLEQGKAIATGTKQTIFEQPQTISVAQLTGCKNFSRAIAKTAHQIEALDWQCTLNITAFLPTHLQQVGIRAHQLTFVEQSTQSCFDSNRINVENTFPCWLAATSETPHRMTLYLKLHTPPNHSNDYHLQAEVFKEKWAILKDQPLPWHVWLDPLRLMLLEG